MRRGDRDRDRDVGGVGYSLAFSEGGDLIGSLDYAFLNGVGFEPRDGQTIPHLLFFAFQATFCIITTALVSGAVVERMRFGAVPGLRRACGRSSSIRCWRYWGFGAGWLISGGTLDFAGGIAVEMASGFSALAAALVVGARKDYGRQALLPHNAVYVLRRRRPAVVRLVRLQRRLRVQHRSELDPCVHEHAAHAGVRADHLVRARPHPRADGDRDRRGDGDHRRLRPHHPCRRLHRPGWAMALGFVGALPCYALIAYRPRTRVDETLDVLAAHGLAGFTGILLIGLVAQASWNGISDGAFYGNFDQFVDQALAAAAVPAYAFIVTFILLKVIGAIMPLRVTREEEAIGMDVTQHGEEAYVTGEGAILVTTEAGVDEKVPVAQP